MKKILSAAMALLLTLSLATPASAAGNGHAATVAHPTADGSNRVVILWASPVVGVGNFTKTRTYTSGSVRGVVHGAWYEDAFQSLYERNMIDGPFSPNGTVTLGEAVSMAVKIHCGYNGWMKPPEGMTDLQYALNTGIVTDGQYHDYNAKATRRSFASILFNALPSEAIPIINIVGDNVIPDVPSTDPAARAIYALYRSGILIGDSQGAFQPDNLVTRAAAAVIMARMVDPPQRQAAAAFPAEAMDISLDWAELTLTKGKSYQLNAYLYPVNTGDPTVKWASSEIESVYVDQTGKVTALQAGRAYITATGPNGVKANCFVQVRDY